MTANLTIKWLAEPCRAHVNQLIFNFSAGFCVLYYTRHDFEQPVSDWVSLLSYILLVIIGGYVEMIGFGRQFIAYSVQGLKRDTRQNLYL